MNGIKRFLKNKNTVTILGLVAIVFVIYFGYNYAVKQAVTPQTVPYAKVTIQPRTEITEDMVGTIEVPPAFLKPTVIRNSSSIVGSFSNVNTIIPEGSLFYRAAVVSRNELPDAALLEVPEGMVVFNLPVDMETTYGNSLYPDNYVDLYMKAIDANGKVIYGKLISNIEILAVKDKNGQHVFENTEEARTPSVLLFAVTEDIHLLLRKGLYLGNDKNYSLEIIPVPKNVALNASVGDVEVSNSELRQYIIDRTGVVNEDIITDYYEENMNGNITEDVETSEE